MGEPAALVLDASVGAKVLVLEDGSEEALALLRPPEGGEARALRVPGHFFIECAAVLRKAVHRGGLPPETAGTRLAGFCELEWEVADVRELAPDALHLANAEGISVYDAVYVALSDRTGAPLVTADRRLHERLRRTGHRVRGLWEFAA